MSAAAMPIQPQRSIVLSGFMATGKSTLGRLVADALALPFVDTDTLIVEDTQRSIAELFASEGEARFRDREAAIILPLLRDGVPRVIAFGGGAVTIPRVRHAALEAATVITLTASPETIASRASQVINTRPNLASSSPIDRARDLLALRREAYGECHVAIATDNPKESAADVAKHIVAIARRDMVAVPLGNRSYVVELGDSAPSMLTDALTNLHGDPSRPPSSIITITDQNVIRARGAWLDQALLPLTGGGANNKLGVRETRIVLTPGEENKTLASVARIWDEALAAGIDRDCIVLAFGGGVVGDLAAFAASTLLRGVRSVQIATTLLAMVDSSVGGKTGFDHAAGKNLLGSFFQPSRVLIDLDHLTTLDTRQRAAAMAEIVKIALVRDPALLETLEKESPEEIFFTTTDTNATGRDVLRNIVRDAVIAKMRVVREDEHESGVRALLNLGHTIGHALESHGGYTKWLHGEAVAIGTVIEIAAAERLSLTPKGTSERAASLLRRFHLPTTATTEELTLAWPFVLTDKKRARSAVKLPIVTAPGEGRVERIELETLRKAILPP